MTDTTSDGAGTSDPLEDQNLSADIRLAAMNLLARREHSLVELRRKLKRRFSDAALIDEQLARLTGENLQSDSRYAQGYVRQRIDKGYGPLRLREELRERGISDGDAELAMEAVEVDWGELSAKVLRGKFGTGPPADIKEKAKRARFMQYRGFTSEHYRRLLGD